MNIYGSLEKKKNGNEEGINIQWEWMKVSHTDQYTPYGWRELRSTYREIHEGGNIIFITNFLDDGKGPEDINPCE